MRSNTLLCGTDPEVILQSITHGYNVSAIGLLPGTKDHPCRVISGAVQVDNVLAEFNTDPAPCVNSFDAVVENVFDQMMSMVYKHDCMASRASVGEYPENQLMDMNARFAGCNPDWNAWTLKLNQAPDYENTQLRAAGGHVHFGVDVGVGEIPRIVKVCDLLITIPMLVADDKRRRTMYGKAGAFRVKPYGLEYRTPSNHWIFSGASRRWMYSRMCEVIDRYTEIDVPPEVRSIINNHDIEQANALIRTFGLEVYPLCH